MIRSRSAIAALVLPMIVLAAMVCGASRADARAVPLSAALAAPTYLVYLYPHASVTYADHAGYNCPDHASYFTDVSAYHWNGSALSAQHWTDHRTLTYWNARHGRVTFDGVTFRNQTRGYVLVAAWCDGGGR